MTAPEIDGYTGLDVIGSGGFSTVYRATQVAFSRRVALKVLNAVETDSETIRRFTRECQSAGALSWHPNIVVVFDAGVTADGRPYLAMEHLPGGSLADAIVTEPMDWHQAVSACVQVADALAAAHESGLMHRDVKPANVLRDRFGHSKLADFGIASVQGSNETATGIVTASIGHAPPEILGGARATVASDVYSLGSTLYALLHGEPAFLTRGLTVAQIIGKVLNEAVPDLRDDGAPAEVAEAVRRAMAKEPADRFASAGAFGAALQAAQIANGVAATRMPASDAHGATESSIDPGATTVIAAGARPPAGIAPDVDGRGDTSTAVPPDVAHDGAAERAAAYTPGSSDSSAESPLPGPPVDGSGRGDADRGGGSRAPLAAIIALALVLLIGGGVWLATRDGDETTSPPSTVQVVDSSSTTDVPSSSEPGSTTTGTGGSSTTALDVSSTTDPAPTTSPTSRPTTTRRPTPAEAAVDLARTLATAIAVDDWETAGSIDRAKAAWTVEQWEFGYGSLVRNELIEYGVIDRGNNVFELSLGLVAFEINGTDQITRLFCVTWISQPTRGEVEQTAGAKQLAPRTGWISIDAADDALRPEC